MFKMLTAHFDCEALREGLPKKIGVLLDFVQMRGGEGPAQIFCPLFTNCILENTVIVELVKKK